MVRGEVLSVNFLYLILGHSHLNLFHSRSRSRSCIIIIITIAAIAVGYVDVCGGKAIWKFIHALYAVMLCVYSAFIVCLFGAYVDIVSMCVYECV